MTEPLVPLPAVEKLSSRVIRVLGGNPSKFTLQGTNTYIVGTGSKRLLIDTGEGKPEWIKSLKSVLDDEDIAIEKALLSHWHHDHIEGVPDLLNVSSKTTVYKRDPEEGWSDISDGQKFETEGATLRAFHCPGHTTDHMAFIIEEEDAMFTADNVLGQGTAVFEDYGTYMKSLDSMSTQFKGRAYPGHGPVIDDGPAKILEYIKHRKLREKQVLDVLAQEKEGGWTAMDIVKVIYKDYPESLYAPAEKGILQILEKLLKEGKVLHDEKHGTWSLAEKSAL
ncbi:Metallo-hydrolase/oxidoreductase [Lophiostoma macrostomum CBS 122681]|uniref:Metallo-hydrolase/oxidoreductase n=1 Tax=Lophiostoma macrostomum CBS 122681 TaxID=1314788 RepID=A0A6A6TP66_9PLEO|nr:Metallo-hydrolase/oxidoreductase [Lophiostoma macrostomum CBS 122681]